MTSHKKLSLKRAKMSWNLEHTGIFLSFSIEALPPPSAWTCQSNSMALVLHYWAQGSRLDFQLWQLFSSCFLPTVKVPRWSKSAAICNSSPFRRGTGTACKTSEQQLSYWIARAVPGDGLWVHPQVLWGNKPLLPAWWESSPEIMQHNDVFTSEILAVAEMKRETAVTHTKATPCWWGMS